MYIYNLLIITIIQYIIRMFEIKKNYTICLNREIFDIKRLKFYIFLNINVNQIFGIIDL